MLWKIFFWNEISTVQHNYFEINRNYILKH
jgi:hypothetical protein